MSDLKNKVIEVIGIALSISIILIVSSIFFLGCNGDNTPIQTSISLIGNYVGAITTLAAAYIASLLFNDWKEQHNKTTLSKEALDIFRSLEDYKTRIKDYSDSVNNQRNLSKPFTKPYTTKYGKDITLSSLIRDILLLEGTFVTNISVILKLTPKTDKTQTLASIGVDELKKCLNDYRRIVEYEYIDKLGVVDERLKQETISFRDNIFNKIDLIQDNLNAYIIFDTLNKNK